MLGLMISGTFIAGLIIGATNSPTSIEIITQTYTLPRHIRDLEERLVCEDLTVYKYTILKDSFFVIKNSLVLNDSYIGISASTFHFTNYQEQYIKFAVGIKNITFLGNYFEFVAKETK